MNNYSKEEESIFESENPPCNPNQYVFNDGIMFDYSGQDITNGEKLLQDDEDKEHQRNTLPMPNDDLMNLLNQLNPNTDSEASTHCDEIDIDIDVSGFETESTNSSYDVSAEEEELITSLKMEVDFLTRIYEQSKNDTSLKIGALEMAIYEVELALKESRIISTPRFYFSKSRTIKSYTKAVIDRLSSLFKDLKCLESRKRTIQPIDINCKSIQSSGSEETTEGRLTLTCLQHEKEKLQENISQMKTVNESFGNHLKTLMGKINFLVREITRNANLLRTPEEIETVVRHNITHTLKNVGEDFPVFYSPRVNFILQE